MATENHQQDEMQPDEYEGQYDPEGNYDPDDPFAAAPKAINFTDEWKKGERYRMTIVERPKLIRGWDQRSKQPATWPDGQPKMVAVTVLEFNGEIRSLWAPKPSALFVGMQNATRAAGQSMRPGGILEIAYGGTDRAAKKPGQNAPHVFPEVTYTPPSR